MRINILTDNPKSWFIPYAEVLQDKLIDLGHDVSFITDSNLLTDGDICFLLSCVKILPTDKLSLNTHNIVIHASDLPQGKGFSPLQWQIIEGKDKIILTLFEAVELCDAGDYYFKDSIELQGNELLQELHSLLAEKIIDMAKHYVLHYKDLTPLKQSGEDSFYPKRTRKDDELDPNKSIAELFNQFRIANNEDYPLYFNYKGCTYNLKIEKQHEK